MKLHAFIDALLARATESGLEAAEVFCQETDRFRAMALRTRLSGQRRLAAIDIIRYLRRKDGCHSTFRSLHGSTVGTHPSHNCNIVAK